MVGNLNHKILFSDLKYINNPNSFWLLINFGSITYKENQHFREVTFISVGDIKNPKTWNYEKYIILKISEIEAGICELFSIYDNNGIYVKSFQSKYSKKGTIIISNIRNFKDDFSKTLSNTRLLKIVKNNYYFDFKNQYYIPHNLIYQLFYYRNDSYLIAKIINLETYTNAIKEISLSPPKIIFDSNFGISSQAVFDIASYRFTINNESNNAYSNLKFAVKSFLANQLMNKSKEIQYKLPFHFPLYFEVEYIEIDNIRFVYKILNYYPYRDEYDYFIPLKDNIQVFDISDKRKGVNIPQISTGYHLQISENEKDYDHIQFISNSTKKTGNVTSIESVGTAISFDIPLKWERTKKIEQKESYYVNSLDRKKHDDIAISKEVNENNSTIRGVNTNSLSIDSSDFFNQIIDELKKSYNIQVIDINFQFQKNSRIKYIACALIKDYNYEYAFIDCGPTICYCILKNLDQSHGLSDDDASRIRKIIEVLNLKYKMSWSRIYFDPKQPDILKKQRFKAIKNNLKIEVLQPIEHTKRNSLELTLKLVLEKINKRIKKK